MKQKIKIVKFFAKLLDSQFEILGIRFGVDPILNIIPYLGAAIGGLLSLYILKTAYDMGVSQKDFLKMIGNILLDVLVGVVPYLGLVFDVFYKANMRNVVILEKYSHGKFVEGELL